MKKALTTLITAWLLAASWCSRKEWDMTTRIEKVFKAINTDGKVDHTDTRHLCELSKINEELEHTSYDKNKEWKKMCEIDITRILTGNVNYIFDKIDEFKELSQILNGTILSKEQRDELIRKREKVDQTIEDFIQSQECAPNQNPEHKELLEYIKSFRKAVHTFLEELWQDNKKTISL